MSMLSSFNTSQKNEYICGYFYKDPKPNIKIKKEKHIFGLEIKRLIFDPYNHIIQEKYVKVMKNNQIKLDEFLQKIKKFYWFQTPQNIYTLTEILETLSYYYALLLTILIKEKVYFKSLQILHFYFKKNDECLKFILENIVKNYPKSGPKNKMLIFYPTIIIKYLSILSCMLKLSNAVKKANYENDLFYSYLKVLIVIKNFLNKDEIHRPEYKIVVKKYTTLFNKALFQSALFSIWNFYPMETSIAILEKLKAYYYNDDIKINEKEEKIAKKVYFNLGLLYYINGHSYKAINILEKANELNNILQFIEPNRDSIKGGTFQLNQKIIEKKRHSAPFSGIISHKIKRERMEYINEIIEFQKKLELALVEIEYDNNNLNSSLKHFKEVLKLMNFQFNTTNDNYTPREIKEIQKVNHYLERIENYEKKSDGKIVEERIKFAKQEDIESQIQTVRDFEKFFLFLSQLSIYQIKILNDNQPLHFHNRTFLPIIFSNEFKNCLSFSQRNEFRNIRTTGLLRYILLRDPNKQISVQNLNYSILFLKEKGLSNEDFSYKEDDDSFSSEKEKLDNKTQTFFNLISMSKGNKVNKGKLLSFFKGNKNSVKKITNNLSEEELKEICQYPNLVKDAILNDDGEKKNNCIGFNFYSFDSDDSDNNNNESKSNESEYGLEVELNENEAS